MNEFGHVLCVRCFFQQSLHREEGVPLGPFNVSSGVIVMFDNFLFKFFRW